MLCATIFKVASNSTQLSCLNVSLNIAVYLHFIFSSPQGKPCASVRAGPSRLHQHFGTFQSASSGRWVLSSAHVGYFFYEPPGEDGLVRSNYVEQIWQSIYRLSNHKPQLSLSNIIIASVSMKRPHCHGTSHSRGLPGSVGSREERLDTSALQTFPSLPPLPYALVPLVSSRRIPTRELEQWVHVLRRPQ